MAIPMNMQAPAVVLNVGAEVTRGVARGARGRNDPGETSNPVVFACRDVVDEVRRRMARRGFLWD